MESPFDVLLIDSDADEEQIEQAYRERVKQAHPDQGGSVEEFQAVRTAYEKLKAGNRGNGAGYRQNGTGYQQNGTGQQQNGAGYRDNGAASERDASGRRASGREPEQVPSDVTYLNYDVLADFGWETDDADLFRKAAAADLDEVDYGQFYVPVGDSLLEAAEDRGFAWPFACRGGACANCAIMLFDGELSMPVSHVLPVEMLERNIRLSCNGMPLTDELKVIYNVKHMPDLEELLLPPKPFEAAYSDD